jgi:hypothetical protein
MSRHTLLFNVFAGGMAFGLAATAARAASASGKLVHRNHTPAVGITVTLSNNRGRSAPARSDTNGSYAFFNIPAGQYFLEVWVNPTTPETVRVTIKEPSTPLPQVTVP